MLAAATIELATRPTNKAGRSVAADGILAGTFLYIRANAWSTPQRAHGPGARSVHASMIGPSMTGQATGWQPGGESVGLESG